MSVWCGFRGACCCASVVWSREGGSDDGEQCKHDTARAGSDWLGHKAQSGTRFWGGDSIAPSSQPSSPTLLDASHQPALGESWSRLLPADCGLSPSWPHTDAYRWQQQRHRHQTSAAYLHKPATRPEHHSLSAPHPTPWRDKPQLRPHRVCIRRTPLGRDRNQAISDVSWCYHLLYHVCSPTRSPCTEVAARTLAPDPPRAAMLLLHAAHRFGGACSSLRSSHFRNRPARAAGAED